ncbi:MAG: hypothetical protein A2W93_05460 [Bacteroidetes bacterium GWF2_43_63]|nr:MAG: hypothetical protein A2W94_11690 [Bacteroidetes bacterium GWE2_42_42]OFY56322.1 MAG: hypothetical protein A2W93_05460 [Bacteroidetes bacterium GWF2_43_63]HBG72002.1 hypothetical protein [Bacteroidales bacterium]HCB61903.1 hypothetical protein [Bacteroidales bacterium]HCY23925.1 hypothetical protein [Bacteroidales bacterium]
MRLVVTLTFITFVFVQSISAQTQSFYKDYPELDSDYSLGYSLLSDSSGYYFLYISDDTLGNNYQSYIARFDTSNVLQWKQPYFTGTDGNSTLSDLIFTSDSCLVFCGGTLSLPNKGTLTKANKQDGSPLFIRTFGDTAFFYFLNVTQTSDSGFLVIGATDSINSTMIYDFYIMKTDKNGYKQWDTVIVLNNRTMFTSSIVSINEVFYFIALKQRNQEYSDNKLIGIKQDGTIVLNKDIVLAAYGGYLGAIAVSNDNQLLLGGQINEYYWPDDPSSGTINDLPYGKMYIGKYDTLGNEIWSKKYFCPNIMQSAYNILSSSDGYYLGGACGWGWSYQGPGIIAHDPSDSFMDNFLMKITESGDSVWTRVFRKQDGDKYNDYQWSGEDVMEGMVRTTDGGIAAVGWFYPLGAGPLGYKQYAWVLKTDSNGCGKPGTPYGLWREELPYNADSSIVHLTWLDDDTTNIWYHVQGSKDGQWYFWELTPRMLTTNEFFDTVPKYHNFCYRVFGLDTTWARTCESAEICITTGINEYAPESGLLAVYPNPAQNEIHCVLPENEDYVIVVYNAASSVVTLSGVEMLITEGLVRTLNISHLSPGIYFVEARGERVLRGKFVKE